MNVKHIIMVTVIVLLTAAFGFTGSKSDDVYFAAHPSISPDAEKIVFSYEGDLWIVNASGGIAYRLTGMDGNERYPRFSPDGKWILFLEYGQNFIPDIYYVPADGSAEPKMLVEAVHSIVTSPGQVITGDVVS